MSNENLHEIFINNSKDFFNEQNLNLDPKHDNIVKNFYKKIKIDKNFFLNNYREWDLQDDYAVPAQFNLEQLKNKGIIKSITNYVIRKIYETTKPEIINGFYDDIEILKKFTDLNLLKINPAHLSPGCKKFFFIDKGMSTNVRWNRYSYLASQIQKYQLLSNNDSWLDIGSYYGGLQSFVKKIYPNINIIMVDFQHQLCRSFIFLKQIFPDSKHIFPDNIDFNINLETTNDTIIYLPINIYSNFKKKIKLFTNFFSLGEMKKKDFDYYLNHPNHDLAENKYMVNRVVSGPHFNRTYDTDINILKYPFNIKNVQYYDVFPIHHYQLQKTIFNGRKAFRPRSSEHFEVIYK